LIVILLNLTPFHLQGESKSLLISNLRKFAAANLPKNHPYDTKPYEIQCRALTLVECAKIIGEAQNAILQSNAGRKSDTGDSRTTIVVQQPPTFRHPINRVPPLFPPRHPPVTSPPPLPQPESPRELPPQRSESSGAMVIP
jgi:hypothetical protein